MSKKKALELLLDLIKQASGKDKPLVRRHHFTDAREDFEKFRNFSNYHQFSHMDEVGPHVGTRTAAHDRWKENSGFLPGHRLTFPDDEKYMVDNARIIPLDADESRPFLIENRVPLEEELLEFFRHDDSEIVRKALMKRNYTNLPYINSGEDPGSVSSIALPKTLRNAITNKRMYGASPLALLPDAGPDE